MRHFRNLPGFTLIELSMVLIIIGLLVGGVLVGQNLISNAAVGGTVAQIEKYSAAVNAFQNKYRALPGDMNGITATNYGFTARGLWAGEGDGNGVVEGVLTDAIGQNGGTYEGSGETLVFWVDLTTANGLNLNYIDGSFSSASIKTTPASGYSSAPSGSSALMSTVLPTAKLGAGNYIYVFSQNSLNYFGLSKAVSISSSGNLSGLPNLTVQQAYDIDRKIDDGLPQSGNVTAQYLNGGVQWAPYPTGVAIGSTATGSTTTCYDDGGSLSNPMQYSYEINSGKYMNCALSFQFQ